MIRSTPIWIEVFDVGDLLGVVLGRVGVDDLKHRVILGGRGNLVVHGDAPGFAQVALGHADNVLVLFAASADAAAVMPPPG
jgi:hypothetical protein